MRKPVDRIGYGGYLKLALDFPEFVDYVEAVCEEFRQLYANIANSRPYCAGKVAVLNCWGKMRSWGCHMVHHAIYFRQNYSYAGVMEALAGAPFDVSFISFTDLLENPDLLKAYDVLINAGDADTAHTGGEWWCNPAVSSAVKRFVYEGGGIIGVGEPAAHQANGHFFQLSNVFGVEEERGFTLGYDKYNWEEHPHFITQDLEGGADFGEGTKNIYALEGTQVLIERDRNVQLAANQFGAGRAVYISGLPYNFVNNRLLHRAILWSAGKEDELCKWFSKNPYVEVNAYLETGRYCVVNNTDETQETVIYRGDGSEFTIVMDAGQILWYEM